MAWTAPKTWSVGEIATAANFNTHIKDNLRYLKGMDGAVSVENDLGVVLAAGASLTAEGTNNSSFGRFRMLAKDGSGNAIDWRMVADGTTGGRYTLYGGVGASLDYRLNVEPNGNLGLGLGTAVAQGRLHGYDGLMGFIFWSYDGVDGTARTVIPNGTGDILYRYVVWFIARGDDGSANTGSILAIAPPPVTHTLLTTGSDTVSFITNADGSATVQRTAGTTRTFKVALYVMWI